MGIVEAAQGLAQLFTALPMGYYADKYGRGPVLKGASVVLVVAVAGIVYALYTDMSFDHTYYIWVCMLSLYGLTCGWLFL